MNYELLICCGQSNMSGRCGGINDVTQIANCYEYKYSSNTFEQLKEPTGEHFSNINCCIATGGSLITPMATKLNSLTGNGVIVVKVSQSDTTITDWQKGGIYYNDLEIKVNAAITKATQSGFNIVHKTFVFLQGESDAINNIQTTEYQTKLEPFYSAVKSDFSLNCFCIIPISWMWSSKVRNQAYQIMSAQNNVAKKYSDIFLGSLKPFNIDESTSSYVDWLHYNKTTLSDIGIDVASNIYKYYTNSTKLSILNENIKKPSNGGNEMYIDMKTMGVHSTTETGYSSFDSSTVIQNVIDNTTSGTLVFEDLARVMINKPIKIHGNIKIKSTASTEFYSSLSGDTMIDSFFYIMGNNVELDGVFINVNRTQLNCTSKGRGIEISTIIRSIPVTPTQGTGTTGGSGSLPPTPTLITPPLTTDLAHIKIKNCIINNCFYGIICYETRVWHIEIENNSIDSVRQDIFFNNVGGRDIKINNNRFLDARNQIVPMHFAGNITVCAGYHFPSQTFEEVYNNDSYESKRIKNIEISNNQFYQVSDRAVRIINAVDVLVENNTIDNKEWGDCTQTGYSDDVISFDFCSTVKVLNNTVNYSGESILDLLSCNDCKVIGNTFTGADDNGIGIGTSDIFDLWYTKNLNPDYLNCKDIIISNNIIGAKYCCIDLRLGNNVIIENNKLFTYPDRNPNAIHLGLTASVNAITDIPSKRHLYNVYSPNDYPQLKLQNIKCNNNIIDKYKANIYLGSEPQDYIKQYFVWGTIELGEELAIEDEFIVDANTNINFVHFKGRYNNVKLYVYLDPAYDGAYITSAEIAGDRWFEIQGIYPYMENGVLKLRGCEVAWTDANQVVVRAGDTLVPVPQRDSDVGRYFYSIARARVKIRTF